jgi:hypothetical protein
LSKESLLQSIGSNIVPAPSGIYIKQLDDDKCRAFVIEVTQSQYPPHQCSHNGVYYLRMDYEAKPAPHGLVQALFNQRRAPKIKTAIIVESPMYIKYNIDIAIMNVTYYPIDKGSFIVEIYNTQSVAPNTKFNLIKKANSERASCYQYNGNINRILTKGIHYTETFEVTCSARDFLIVIAHWSMHTTTCIDYYWIQNGKVIESFEDSEIVGSVEIQAKFEHHIKRSIQN